MKKYYVTANHPVAKYKLSMHPALVGQSGDKFYCQMTTLGCGKDYATVDAAIRGLVADHGYTNIQWWANDTDQWHHHR